MLRRTSHLTSAYVLKAEDGEIGRCKDFLFDDEKWAIRYMVADTGKWLPGRKVLLSPILLGRPDWATLSFPVDLTRRQIEESPPLDEHRPVSRRYEKKISKYYDMAYYWTGGAIWENFVSPSALRGAGRGEEETEQQQSDDVHLRSTKEVIGYHIEATDREVGHVEDFLVEDETWCIRYLLVDTGNWLPGHKVLLSPLWVVSADWKKRRVRVDVSDRQVKDSPAYDPKAPLERKYETRIFDHYGRRTYWS
jgi:hypothetical protein